MSRIFITGDTHGTIDFKKLTMRHFPIQKELNKSDILIICGDSGLCWSGKDDDKWLQQWYEDKNFTTLIVDGNHENHMLISKLPIIEKFGGKVHQISNSVFYAIRGEIYTINGKKILTLGGAESIDKQYRVEGYNWWKDEEITIKDFKRTIDNLERGNFKVDYFITHTGGGEVARNLGFLPTNCDKYVSFFLDTLRNTPHYCGHYHVDRIINKQSRILFDDIIELPSNLDF